MNEQEKRYAHWRRALVGEPQPALDAADLVAELQREIALRLQVYPKWVAARRISPELAARRIALLQEAARRLTMTAAPDYCRHCECYRPLLRRLARGRPDTGRPLSGAEGQVLARRALSETGAGWWALAAADAAHEPKGDTTAAAVAD